MQQRGSRHGRGCSQKTPQRQDAAFFFEMLCRAPHKRANTWAPLPSCPQEDMRSRFFNNHVARYPEDFSGACDRQRLTPGDAFQGTLRQRRPSAGSKTNIKKMAMNVEARVAYGNHACLFPWRSTRKRSIVNKVDFFESHDDLPHYFDLRVYSHGSFHTSMEVPLRTKKNFDYVIFHFSKVLPLKVYGGENNSCGS